MYQQEPESLPFKVEVDPQANGAPKYLVKIKQPMDLCTIRRKLLSSIYTDPWLFIDDMYLMFNNTWTFCPKASKIYRYCFKLVEIFEREIQPVMKELGYCCGQKYTFTPKALNCYGKDCQIQRNENYFSYLSFAYCGKCFRNTQEQVIELSDGPAKPPLLIPKASFVQLKNDRFEDEPFVTCIFCKKKFHRICVLHLETICYTGFACDNCLKAKKQERKRNPFNAKGLPTTKLGAYIEKLVKSFLNKKKAGSGEVLIRVVSVSEKRTEINPAMKAKYHLSKTFPYKAKAIFAFEEIDGKDVCFFGMHVQEYGSGCPAPNTRRVYLAYLDSVHYFQPPQFRTAVYHQIILGYLKYVKRLGYSMAHIWACPPPKGDDYMFNCHPSEQKIPSSKRLQDWYRNMLEKGVAENIVLEFTDYLKQAKEDNIKSATELPYFDGDYWPTYLEDSIKELDQEEEKRKKQAETLEPVNKRARRSGINKRNSKKSKAPVIIDLSTKMFQAMKMHKDLFFAVKLNSEKSPILSAPIQDPDPLMPCELMNGRDAFLALCKENNYEFSTLRRAKFSTMAMLYELHNRDRERFVYTCDRCRKHLVARLHCNVCYDFDLCEECFYRNGHDHQMAKIGFGTEDTILTKEDKVRARENKKLAIRKALKCLYHSSSCRNTKCTSPPGPTSCNKMKKVLDHAKVCDRTKNVKCHICRQVMALSCLHAERCLQDACIIPFCAQIKQKFREQRAQKRSQESELLKRKIQNLVSRADSERTPTTTIPATGKTTQLTPTPLIPGTSQDSKQFFK